MGEALAPRLLTDRQLADYLNLPLTEVAKLTVGRLRFGTRVRFDRKAIDAHLDERQGLKRYDAPAQEDDAEAALARFLETQRPAQR